MKFSDYLKIEERVDTSEVESDWDDLKSLIHDIAKEIDQEEFRFKTHDFKQRKTYKQTDRTTIPASKYASKAQNIAQTYITSNLTIPDIIKFYKLSQPEALRLMKFLDDNYGWTKNNKHWQ